MNLKDLQEIGAIASNLRLVSMDNVKLNFIDQLVVDKEAQRNLQGIVTVSDPNWIATSKRIPAQEANVVYSCSDDLIGCWDKNQNTFLLCKLIENRLAVTRKFKIKKPREEKRMANLAAESMDSFNLDDLGAGVDTPTVSKDEKVSKTDQNNAAIASVRQKLGGIALPNSEEAKLNNRKNGRIMFFITKTDSAIKLGSSSVVQLDDNNKRVVDPALLAEKSEESRKKWETSGNYPATVCKREKILSFKHAKPGKIVGAVFAVPTGSEVSLAAVSSSVEKDIIVDDQAKDLKYSIMPIEAAYDYAAANFGNVIKESEEILGNRAGEIVLKISSPKQTGDGMNVVTSVKASFAVQKSENGNRKSLLTEGNYFPLKVYNTVGADSIDAETAAMLNHHVEAIYKDDEAYNKFSDNTHKAFRRDAATGKCTCDVFNNGKSVQIKKYDATSELDVVTDIRFPLRKKVINDTSHKVTFPFDYHKIGEEGGPDTIAKYKELVDAIGMSMDEFVKIVSNYGAAVKKSKRDQLTADDYLAIRKSHAFDTGITQSIIEMAEAIR